MCDTIGSGHWDSIQKSENTNVEDIKPVCEQITTIKTEVVEECYNYGILDDVESVDVKPFSTSEDLQSGTNEDLVSAPYEQILKNDHYEQHIVWCEEGNDVGHTLVNGKKQFECEICGKLFRRKGYLKKHVEIHDNEGEKEVCCPYTNVSLQSHIDIIKPGDKLYKCKYCGHSTQYKKNMVNRERSYSSATLLKCRYKNCTCEQRHVSNKEKSCDCDPCQFETAYTSNLRKHVFLKHTVNAKRLTCTVCTYSTHYKEYLKKHMANHVNKEFPNKYKCEDCYYMTHRKENLKRHRVIHTNKKVFKCTHINCKCDCIGKKPCDCETCGFETIHSDALRRHILTQHSGKTKKHTCTYCDYSTHIKAHLRRHLCTHTNAKSIPSENS